MKKLIYLSLLSLPLFIAACGNDSKLPNDGLLGDLPNIYLNYDVNKNYDEIVSKMFEDKGIPVEVDNDVPLTVENMYFNKTIGSTSVKFVGEAKIKRAGVYDAATAWADPKNDDEAYDFYWRIGMLMYDKEGEPIYAPDFLLTGLQKSGLQRIVNLEGAACNYTFTISLPPTDTLKLTRLANVAKIMLIDRKGEHADEYNQIKEEQEKNKRK